MLAAALAHGCVAMGWTFGPALSCRSPALFAAPPVVVHRGDAYVLAWTYGSSGFFFHPDYRPREGRLVFALAATSSSGQLAGRRGEAPIEGAEAIAALRSGGGWWWEPDGSQVKLAVLEEARH